MNKNLEIKEIERSIDSLEKWLSENEQHVDREKVQRQINILQVKLKSRRDAEHRARKPNVGLNEYHLPTKYL